MQIALSLCESGRLQYVSPTCCRLKKEFVAPDEDEWWDLDLKNYVLPATRLVPGSKLSSEPRLAIATVLAIDVYLRNADHAKATHRTISTMVSTIVKFWEWGRLNSVYRPEDWTEAHFQLLGRQLGEGRWAVALQARSRVQQFLKTKPNLKSICRLEAKFGLRGQIKDLLGTNLSTLELGCARNSIHRYAQPVEPPKGWAADSVESQPGVTWLLQAFWAANLLVNVPKPYGFKFTPFPNPMARARKLSKPNRRTPTLSIEQAIGLLTHSTKYVYDYSKTINYLIAEVGRIFLEVKNSKVGVSKRRQFISALWEKSLVRIEAEAVLGVPISIMSRTSSAVVTLPKLINMLMGSCVILISGMNSRRKDEIIHRKVGLHRDSIKPVNEELHVYEGMFYIEKTLKSYAPFFVNKATFDAFCVLQELEKAQLDFEHLHTKKIRSEESLSHSMFWSRSWSPTNLILQPRTWFAFTSDTVGAGNPLSPIGEDIKITRGGAHVFRRFYAIIYFYRFEHGGLLALRYQLGHFNCEMTKQYVTSAMIQAVETRIPVELRRQPEAIRTAMSDEWGALDKEIQKVGVEKLHTVIAGLVDGKTFSGGFPRLIERLHRRLMSDIDYAALDKERQARQLLQRVTSRGHALRPLPHADCAAGTSRARGAKCSNEKGSGPAPENANATLCSACPYSWTSEGHIAGLKKDLEVLNADIGVVAPGSLLWERRINSRDNLQNAIWLHEKRIHKVQK